MKRNEPYWHRLIDHFMSQRYIANGLTIPYIVGAICTTTDQNIDQILRDTIMSMSRIGATVMYCDNIGEYVFGVLDKETEQYHGSKSNRFNRILVTDESFNEIPELTDLINEIHSTYRVPLNKKLFSKNRGQWTKFNKVDIKRINEVD